MTNNTKLNKTNQTIYKSINTNRDIDPLAMLFFFLGALHIYPYLRQIQTQAAEKTRQDKPFYLLKINNQIGSLSTLALLGLIIAGAIELYQVYS